MPDTHTLRSSVVGPATCRIDALTPSFGSAVTGIDLSAELDEVTVALLRTALAERGVLVFRGQAISDAAHVRFARCFGEPVVFRKPDNPQQLLPEIFRVANTDLSGALLPRGSERIELLKLNWYWHTDSSYRAAPAKVGILHGIEVFEDAGDTLFANMVAAYAALPAVLESRIATLVARHSFEFQVTNRGLPPMRADELARLPPVEHPLVRQHADGRRSLFLSPPYMDTIIGWNPRDSRALIEELEAWATQERFVYRHRWRTHDVVVWDNDWTMHKVTSYDINGRRRVLHGTVILGQEPVHPASRA